MIELQLIIFGFFMIKVFYLQCDIKQYILYLFYYIKRNLINKSQNIT